MQANHDRNFEAFCDSLAAGIHTVIVDNTNIQAWHYERYEEAAHEQALGYPGLRGAGGERQTSCRVASCSAAADRTSGRVERTLSISFHTNESAPG
jgi:hypothetical protein